jgi:multidrug resistance efflux pump
MSESVAAGIEDRDRSAGATLLANVNPTFNWVRLAQRVPVRIALDRTERSELVAGATATVEVLGSTLHGGAQGRPSASQRLACRAVQAGSPPLCD